MDIVAAVAVFGTLWAWLLWSFITFWKAAIEGNRAITKGNANGMPESQQRKNYVRFLGSMGFVIAPFVWISWQLPETTGYWVLIAGGMLSAFIHSRPHKIVEMIKGGDD